MNVPHALLHSADASAPAVASIKIPMTPRYGRIDTTDTGTCLGLPTSPSGVYNLTGEPIIAVAMFRRSATTEQIKQLETTVLAGSGGLTQLCSGFTVLRFSKGTSFLVIKGNHEQAMNYRAIYESLKKQPSIATVYRGAGRPLRGHSIYYIP